MLFAGSDSLLPVSVSSTSIGSAASYISARTLASCEALVQMKDWKLQKWVLVDEEGKCKFS